MPRPCHKPLPYIEQFRPQKKLVLCPFDATVIPLTSKLFWLQEYRQIKLIQSFQRFWGMGELSIHRWKGFELYPVINKKTVTTLHQDTKSTGHLITSPGQEHEINFGEDMVETLPENSIAVSVIL
jgi:hypothetical protein